jgi:hypothetical protein
MRLGSRATVLQTMNCITAKLYQKEVYVEERHRHRWGGWGGRLLLGRRLLGRLGWLGASRAAGAAGGEAVQPPPARCPAYPPAHPPRYEVNPELVPRLEEAGLMFVGKDETGAAPRLRRPACPTR